MSQVRNSQGLNQQRTVRPASQQYLAVPYTTNVPMYTQYAQHSPYAQYVPGSATPSLYPQRSPVNLTGPARIQTFASPNCQMLNHYPQQPPVNIPEGPGPSRIRSIANPSGRMLNTQRLNHHQVSKGASYGPIIQRRRVIAHRPYPPVNGPVVSLARPSLQIRRCPPRMVPANAPLYLPTPPSAPVPGSRVLTAASATANRPAQPSQLALGSQRRGSAPPTYPAIHISNAPLSRRNRELRRERIRLMQFQPSHGNCRLHELPQGDDENKIEAALTLLQFSRDEKRKCDEDEGPVKK